MDRITLRLEAARIAAQLTGVSTKNFIPVARRVERYIEGERATARRPDTLSRQMLQATGSCLADGYRTPARDAPTSIADGVQYLAPGGIPSSEAESIFLQADGEKVE